MLVLALYCEGQYCFWTVVRYIVHSVDSGILARWLRTVIIERLDEGYRKVRRDLA